MIWIGVAAGVIVLFLVAQTVYLGVVLASNDQATNGLGYFGRPPDGRREFREKLRHQARTLAPILRLFGRLSGFTFEKAGFEGAGLRGPRGTCTPESFAAGAAYRPEPEDVFVVTQMKCGTTWMQHVVYEVLRRGSGDLVESGTALYAVSPWLEATKSVPVDEAPLIGSERPSRVIKTHFPAAVCPRSEASRYIYVARHPVSCFASCVDFIAENAGRMAPPVTDIERWFCSGDMWWGPWTHHVEGWWDVARGSDNTLFVHFEEMRTDLPSVVRRVAAFLGLAPLSDEEEGRVVRKCGFDYMSEHAGTFEMHPPHLLATDAQMFVKGTTDRHRDVPAETRARIAAWCVDSMGDASYPLLDRYPDLADSRA